MIVSEVMTTKLVTVRGENTLGHAASLLRQYQFHHLPVVRTAPATRTRETRQAASLLEGLLTSQDIDLAVALEEQRPSSPETYHTWQERRVGDVMHPASVRVTPTTSLTAAARLRERRGHEPRQSPRRQRRLRS